MSVRGFAVEGIEPLPDGDTVLDFEVTANRPDCLSMRGLAREVATAYGLPLREDDRQPGHAHAAGTREPSHRGASSAPDLCGRATSAPSPP